MASNNITPYGYRMENGKAVIVEEEAKQLRDMCAGYLSGLSFVEAARQVGLTMYHGTVRNLLKNKKYIGNDFYPPILDKESFEAVEIERRRREEKLGRTHKKRRTSDVKVKTAFTVSKVDTIYPDPITQAEYAYSLIQEVE